VKRVKMALCLFKSSRFAFILHLLIYIVIIHNVNETGTRCR
jgi:hypothetical protein